MLRAGEFLVAPLNTSQHQRRKIYCGVQSAIIFPLLPTSVEQVGVTPICDRVENGDGRGGAVPYPVLAEE